MILFYFSDSEPITKALDVIWQLFKSWQIYRDKLCQRTTICI